MKQQTRLRSRDTVQAKHGTVPEHAPHNAAAVVSQFAAKVPDIADSVGV